MKILVFSVAFHPFIGGAEIAVKEITDRNPDIEFHLVTVNLDGKQLKEEKIGNVFVYRVGSGSLGKLFFPFFGLVKGLSLHSKHTFSATWSILAGYSGFAALFFKYLKPNVPFILNLQEGDPIEYIKRQVWFVYPLFVQIFRKADRIQAISNYLADFARSMGARVTILVIPNGVDVSQFSKEFPVQELESLKTKLGKKSGDTFLVTSSRLVLKNGVEDVISALTFLPQNVKFLILGTGPLEAELKRLARKLDLLDRVIFQGFVDQNDVPKYLKISDIFIRPSLSEGMGISFIEAMSARIPVIATPVGGIPDFLKDPSADLRKATGLFCEVQNPKSIAEIVNKLISDPALGETITSNAHNLVKEKFDWNLVAKDMREKVFLV